MTTYRLERRTDATDASTTSPTVTVLATGLTRRDAGVATIEEAERLYRARLAEGGRPGGSRPFGITSELWLTEEAASSADHRGEAPPSQRVFPVMEPDVSDFLTEVVLDGETFIGSTEEYLLWELFKWEPVRHVLELHGHRLETTFHGYADPMEPFRVRWIDPQGRIRDQVDAAVAGQATLMHRALTRDLVTEAMHHRGHATARQRRLCARDGHPLLLETPEGDLVCRRCGAGNFLQNSIEATRAKLRAQGMSEDEIFGRGKYAEDYAAAAADPAFTADMADTMAAFDVTLADGLTDTPSGR